MLRWELRENTVASSSMKLYYKILMHLMRRTTRKRLMVQDRCTATCQLSDSADDEFQRSLDDEEVDVYVNDERPAVVEPMSCNSSFSDCSLPCHELVTCSSATQLAKGHVKVTSLSVKKL